MPVVRAFAVGRDVGVASGGQRRPRGAHRGLAQKALLKTTES